MLRLFLITLFFSTAPLAVMADALRAAQARVQAGAPAEALVLLRGYQPATQAAEIGMLWTLAVANMRLRQPAAALPHLERLVALQPRQTEFRLELAAALGQLGQNERALYHLDIARSAGLPPQIDARAAEFARRLESPKVLSGHLSVSIVSETNPAKRTSATEVNIFGLPFVINPAARAQSATGLMIDTGAVLTPQIAPGLRGQVGFATQFRLYGGKAPDDYTGRLYAGLIHGFQETGETRAQVFVTRRWLDERQYSRSVGLSLSHSRRLTPSTRVDGGLTHERITYRNGTTMRRDAARASVTQTMNPQLDLSFGIRTEKRRSANIVLAGHTRGFSLGGQYRFAGGLQVASTLDYERNQVDGLHPLFLRQRKDTRRSARLDLSNSQWNWNGFAPVLRLSYERQNSTIVINEFQNISASIGVTRRF